MAFSLKQTRGLCNSPKAPAHFRVKTGRGQTLRARANAEIDDGRGFAIAAASILNDTKCNDIVVLDVSPIASWTSYMVFCGVFSECGLLPYALICA